MSEGEKFLSCVVQLHTLVITASTPRFRTRTLSGAAIAVDTTSVTKET